MTRRIALTILFTVWAMLIAGGLGSFLVVRTILLADLDASIVARAMSLPEVVKPEGRVARSLVEPSDRYGVFTESWRTYGRPTSGPAAEPASVVVVQRDFVALADGHRVRTLRLHAEIRPAPRGAPVPGTITYSASAARFDAVLNHLMMVLALIVLVGGLMSAWVAWRTSREALRPLRRTAETIGSIDENNLSRRIDGSELPIELQPMADHLNAMLGRIEDAFAQRKQFIGDASHELRTPVAAMVTTLEVSLRRPRDADGYRTALETCLGDAQLLRRLVERLLEQVRSESLSHGEPAQPIEISTMLSQCADLAAGLGAARDIAVLRNFAPGLTFHCQPQRLRSVITNLVSNAVEYNHPGGRVELAAVCNGDGLQISVSDTGPGIAAEHLPRLFEPFYRVETSPRTTTEHLGLGLSLVRAHARAMGGHCSVESTPGHGTTFRVHLPTTQSQSQPVANIRITAPLSA